MIYANNKWVCFLLAMILFFWGIGVEITTNDSSFLRGENIYDDAGPSIFSVKDEMGESPVCAFFMKNYDVSAKNSMTGSGIRWQNRGYLLFLIVGSFLQYLFCYQSTECKEDGQLILCRSAIVDYIHQKDSGE